MKKKAEGSQNARSVLTTFCLLPSAFYKKKRPPGGGLVKARFMEE